MKMTAALITGLLLFVVTGPYCLAEEIEFRVLNVQDARPIANERVSVQFHVATTDELQIMESTTAIDGDRRLYEPATSMSLRLPRGVSGVKTTAMEVVILVRPFTTWERFLRNTLGRVWE